MLNFRWTPPQSFCELRKWLDQRCSCCRGRKQSAASWKMIQPKGGSFYAEGLYYIDEEPLRAFFMIDVESMVVEITDFRIL